MLTRVDCAPSDPFAHRRFERWSAIGVIAQQETTHRETMREQGHPLGPNRPIDSIIRRDLPADGDPAEIAH